MQKKPTDPNLIITKVPYEKSILPQQVIPFGINCCCHKAIKSLAPIVVCVVRSNHTTLCTKFPVKAQQA
jgi:hypothetical protein